MTFYILCAVLPLVIGIGIQDLNRSQKKKALYLLFVFTVLGLILGSRSASVGIDTEAYSGYLLRIGTSEDYLQIVDSAPIYSLVNRGLYRIFPSVQFLLLAAAMATCYFTAFFIYEFSDRVEISSFLFVSLYFYENAFNGMRQGLAIAIILVAAVFIGRRQYIFAIVACLCSLGTHLISLVAVPFLLLGLADISKKKFKMLLLGILGCSLLVLIGFEPLLNMAVGILPGYAKYLPFLYDEKYLTQGRNIFQSLFFLLLLFVYCIRVVKSEKETVRKRDALLILAPLFGYLWATVFYWNAFIGPRISLFPTAFIIATIPNMFTMLDSRTFEFGPMNFRIDRLFECCVLIACLALQIIQLYGNYAGVIPYVPFWG